MPTDVCQRRDRRFLLNLPGTMGGSCFSRASDDKDRHNRSLRVSKRAGGTTPLDEEWVGVGTPRKTSQARRRAKERRKRVWSSLPRSYSRNLNSLWARDAVVVLWDGSKTTPASPRIYAPQLSVCKRKVFFSPLPGRAV